MKKLLGVIVGLLALTGVAFAQSGQIPAGGIWGNATASKAPGQATTIFSVLNQVSGCTTQNNIIVRGASLWACATTGSGVVTWLGTPSSANLAAAVTDETGSGSLVFGTSPSISGLTVTSSFTATGLVTYGAFASSALATASQYYAATANTIVPTNVIYPTETTTTYGTTTTFDFNTFINTAVTLTGNITTMTLSNVRAGKSGTITFIQDGTGSRTSVFSTTFKFAGGAIPVLSTTANAIDVLTYSCRSATFCVASLMKDVRNP